LATQKGTIALSVAIFFGLTLSSLPGFPISNCDTENDVYKHSVKVCQDLEKASNAAGVALAIASATLNPIAIGAALTTATSAAKAAEHNCKIRDNKEKSLVRCINLFNETLRQSIQSAANSYNQTEKQLEITKLWQSANLQHQDRLYRFLQEANSAKKSTLLLSEEWLHIDGETLSEDLAQIKREHRVLRDKVKTYESNSNMGPVIKYPWN
jgi:hypothetical protein